MDNIVTPTQVRILVLTSSPTCESGLLRYATALAEARKASITVLHMVGPDKGPVGTMTLMWERPVSAMSGIKISAYRLAIASEEGVRLFVSDLPHDIWLMDWSENRERMVRVAEIAADCGATAIVVRNPAPSAVRSILMTTAGGRHSLEALRIGNDLSTAWDAEGEVLRVVSRETFIGGSTLFRRHCRQEYSTTQLQLDLAGIRHPIRMLTNDDPVSAIVGQSARHDLLVLGGTSVWGMEHLLPGSLPEEVSRQVACPTLIVQVPDAIQAGAEQMQ